MTSKVRGSVGKVWYKIRMDWKLNDLNRPFGVITYSVEIHVWERRGEFFMFTLECFISKKVY